MGLSGCYGFMKYVLMFVNLIFWAVGLATVVLAIWMLTDDTFLMSLTQEQHNYHAGLYILLAAGVLMLVVAFLGCCGAFRESQCMLVAFFSCLLVVVVAQIAAGAWLYSKSDRFDDLVERSVRESVKHEYDVIDSRTATMNSFQSKLQCCGATLGPQDWLGSEYNKKHPSAAEIGETYLIPRTCCKDESSEACEKAVHLKVGGTISDAINKEGCVPKLVQLIKSQLDIILGVTIAAGILQLIGLIFSMVLCCAIGSSDRYKA